MKITLAIWGLTVFGLLLNTASLAVAWALLASTALDLPSIGGPIEYFCAAVALWLIGPALSLNERIAQFAKDAA